MRHALALITLTAAAMALGIMPADAAITIIASTVVAGITAAATGAAVGASMLLAAGVATAQWGIRKFQELTKPKGAGGGSGVPTPAETQINGGARTASHVVGRAKVTDSDHLLAFVNTADLGNDRTAFNIFHVLSEGPCEGVEQIWIDDYLAMEAPKDGSGNYVVNGANQHMTPTTGEYINDDGEVQTWQEVYRAAIADGKTPDEAIEVLDMTDFFRFRALQRVQRRYGGVRGTDPIYITGGSGPSGLGSVWLADWGTWCRAWIYPNGAGDQGANIIANIGSNPDIPYELSYRFDGKCVVHLQLEKSNFDSPFSSGIPKVDYVLKGRKLTWPGQSTPAWTENAAAIRYWFHRELEGIPANKLDEASFREAYAKCAEMVDYTALTTDQDLLDLIDEAGYTTEIPRYTINGLLLHDPSLYEQYKTDMDMAWQGNMVDSRGKLLFRPGFQRPVAFRIGEHNTVDTISFTPQPAENDRVNAVRATMQQSLDDNFEPVDLPVVQDDIGVQRDGAVKERELQGLRFIKYPLAAMNAMHIFLRRNRSVGRLTKRIQIDPTDFDGNKYDPVNCLDFTPVTDPELGLADAPFDIVSWRRNADWTIDLNLQELRPDTFTDTLDVPPFHRRRLALPDDTTLPLPPTGLTAVQDVYVIEDGSIYWGIKVTVNPTGHSTEIDISNADGTFTASHILGAGAEVGEFTVPGAGTYSVTARHINFYSRRSAPVTASVTVSGDHLVPPVPRLRLFDIRGGNLTMFFQPFDQTNFDVIGIEFRYRVRSTTDTTAFPVGSQLTEAQWDNLPRLAADPVASSVGSFSVDLQIPFSGRYQIFARSYTRQGLRSAITSLGQYTLIGLQAAGGTSVFNPASQGTRSNMAVLWDADGDAGITTTDGEQAQIEESVVHDRANASRLTFNDWNGANGWPFGSEASASWRINPAVEFESQGNYALRYSIATWEPDTGSAPMTTPDIDVYWQGRVNGTAAGNRVSAGDGTTGITVRGVNEVEMIVEPQNDGYAIVDIRAFWEVSV